MIYQQYEAEKRKIREQNLTPKQYERKIKELAIRLGV